MPLSALEYLEQYQALLASCSGLPTQVFFDEGGIDRVYGRDGPTEFEKRSLALHANGEFLEQIRDRLVIGLPESARLKLSEPLIGIFPTEDVNACCIRTPSSEVVIGVNVGLLTLISMTANLINAPCYEGSGLTA